jgi:hypothetical protein
LQINQRVIDWFYPSFSYSFLSSRSILSGWDHSQWKDPSTMSIKDEFSRFLLFSWSVPFGTTRASYLGTFPFHNFLQFLLFFWSKHVPKYLIKPRANPRTKDTYSKSLLPIYFVPPKHEKNALPKPHTIWSPSSVGWGSLLFSCYATVFPYHRLVTNNREWSSVFVGEREQLSSWERRCKVMFLIVWFFMSSIETTEL